jgi:hypothetical protein
MVDRESRTSACELLRHLVAGQITNDDFEGRFPRSNDLAVREAGAAGWMLYDDRRTHRLVGKDRIGRDARQVVVRFVLFLQTGHEYQWPPSSGLVPALWLAATLLTLGYARRVERRRFEQHGDIEAWPFVSRADLEEAARNPRYLRTAV